jgi:uncharacterized protein (DUF983 family)
MIDRSAAEIALLGGCPHCGNGRLFRGFSNLAPRCGTCGLAYDFADAGDGPALSAMMIAVVRPMKALMIGLDCRNRVRGPRGEGEAP